MWWVSDEGAGLGGVVREGMVGGLVGSELLLGGSSQCSTILCCAMHFNRIALGVRMIIGCFRGFGVGPAL